MAKRTKNNKGGQALVIVLAIVAVAVIVWLVFFRKNKRSVKSILRYLEPDLNLDEQRELEEAVAVCETWPESELKSQLTNTDQLTHAQLVVINALFDTCMDDLKIRSLQSKVITM